MFLTILKFLVRITSRSEKTTQELPENVEIRRAAWLPALGGIFSGRKQPMSAVTIGRTIVIHPKRDITERLLRHELVHVNQWEQYGLTFPFRYGMGHIRHGYQNNPFEVEAEAAE